MGRKPSHYSVYDRRTDQPILVYATMKECLEIIGLTTATFYSYLTFTRNGKHKRRYDIYKDEEDEEDGK